MNKRFRLGNHIISVIAETKQGDEDSTILIERIKDSDLGVVFDNVLLCGSATDLTKVDEAAGSDGNAVGEYDDNWVLPTPDLCALIPIIDQMPTPYPSSKENPIPDLALMIGSRIVAFGSLWNKHVPIEGGGIGIDYIPAGDTVVRRLSLGFNENGAWTVYVGVKPQ